jgi:3-hydroxyisobutyryl-CoA hydrolase
MRLGKKWNIAQAFQNEHAIASEFMRHPDFVEGVTARLITRSKERPNWKPNQIEDVREADVNAFYAQVDNPSTALKLISTGTEAKYEKYPYAWLGLPTEAEIKERLAQKPAEEVIQDIITEKNGKMGVREKVEEVLERL